VKYYTNKARQAGMTLIELTVVLLVLVGLAGLLIPYVSGFVTKTHDSTGSSNIQALNNAMARYEVEHYDNFPDNMDSLINATTNTVYQKMMGEMMGTSYLTPLQLNGAKAKALGDIGIKNLMLMDDAVTANDATFNNTTTSASVSAGSYVAEITGMPLGDLDQRLGQPVNTGAYHYLAFGVGDDSNIVGATLSQVPVHFAADGDMGANNAYNHFVAIFQVLRQDACIVGTWGTVYLPDDQAAFDLGTNSGADNLATIVEPIADTVIGAANATACLALNDEEVVGWTEDGGATGTGKYIASGITWAVSSTEKAKFMGTAMAMGMGQLEGLGGSLTRYYKNSATN